MTTAKNQRHHEAELFTRILTRMARLAESVEGLNEEMDELRKVLDGMGDNEVGVKYDESREFVYSIHPGAYLNREPGYDGDPVWSVVKHLEGPRISGSESTSWKMAWVYAAEILKAERASEDEPIAPFVPVSHKDMVKEVYPAARISSGWDNISGRWAWRIVTDRSDGMENLSGLCLGESDAWENAASRITEAHKSLIQKKYKNGPTVSSCAKSDGATNQHTHEVWVGDNFDGGHSTCIGSGQSEFAAWFAAARNCGLASEPVAGKKPTSVWSTKFPEKDGWYWASMKPGEWKDGPEVIFINTERGSRWIWLNADEVERMPTEFPNAIYGPEITPPEMSTS